MIKYLLFSNLFQPVCFSPLPSINQLAVPSPPVGLLPPPSPLYIMPPIRNFIGALAVAGKSFKEIQETPKNIYSKKALKKVKEGKSVANQRFFNGRRRSGNRRFSPVQLPRLAETEVSLSENSLRPMVSRLK